MIILFLTSVKKWLIARPNKAEQYIISHNPKTVADVELLSKEFCFAGFDK
jgi:hypothetical protein